MPVRDERSYVALARAGLIAVALLLCGAAEKGPQGHQELSHADQPQANSSSIASLAPAGHAPKPKPPPCNLQGGPNTAAPDCREAIAAERTADRTEALVIVGAIQAVLLLGQIIALVMTVRQSRVATQVALDSVGAAQRSAKAAEDAVAKSDEMLEHSRTTAAEALNSNRRIERAYVFLKIDPIEKAEKDATKHTLFLRYLNIGKTPAIIDQFYFGRLKGKPAAPPIPVYPDEKEAAIRIEPDAAVPAGDSHPAMNTLVERIDQVIFGYIKYRDIFGNPHISRFAMLFEWRQDHEMFQLTSWGGVPWNSWD